MRSDPLVSVIVPTYNRGDFVCDTIENILGQTYRNIELIVVDDGSTDDTRAKLRYFGAKLQVISQENAGPAVARNRGAQIASGEIIAFQDSDDLWKDTKLETQVALLHKVDRSVPCCICNASMSLPDGSVTSSFEFARMKPDHQEGIWLNAAEVLATRFLLFNQTVAIRREAWERTGGFDESLKYLDDLDLPLRLALDGPWVFSSECLVIYRQGAWPSFSKKGHDDLICTKQCAVRIFEETLERVKKGGRHPTLRRHLKRRLKTSRRELLAAKMAQMSFWGARLAGTLLKEGEHYRNAILRRSLRSRWFPKMESIPVQAVVVR